MANWLWEYGNTICHQSSERSMFVGDIQMPLCVRCFAWYISALTTLVIVMCCLWKRKEIKGFYFSFPATVILLGCGGVLFVDGVTQALGWRESFNALRILSGILFGVSTILLATSVYFFHKKNSVRLTVSGALPLLLVCSMGSGCMIVLSVLPVAQPFLMYLMVVLAHFGNFFSAVLFLFTLYIAFFRKVEV